ncbi:peroxiredoxin [Methylococcus capsulatus]|jgi:peroxiredoxin Q/BCP|uniref:thioredoxin-dependent peroxiredoxin n=2 Tax=Methylococcus capsulatus TaxID=414 RepID=Q60B20_METCA|nr:peroxiredoxin [Methylococcus capsulatus]AAU93019.1 antioxidant, AhpC/Tsa family [Methylococcus capsulatus str. Bath]QXP88531.1 peroxiredoxin [Methylococcus capsulatus]QXP90104.1 peroxiredoxin [Methylococcus capsulatus]QXP94453.1 peroxiredoxin [Methylococcus capsulatus]UQN13581.1 peroxiredoxin [Methylococcus capsulatus]
MNTPTLGQAVPDFQAESTSGGTFRLSQRHGRPLVLYFYPKDSTPGCTQEGQDFRDLYPEFQKLGADIVGVSRDSLKSHERFRCKYGFPFELLSDGDEALCRLFDVIRLKNMYGKQVRGIERSTFLIDAEGRLAAEWRKVSVKGHAEEVLRAVAGLAAKTSA